MDEWIDRWRMDGWMDGWMNGWMGGKNESERKRGRENEGGENRKNLIWRNEEYKGF